MIRYVEVLKNDAIDDTLFAWFDTTRMEFIAMGEDIGEPVYAWYSWDEFVTHATGDTVWGNDLDVFAAIFKEKREA